jgi:hypothetical protein
MHFLKLSKTEFGYLLEVIRSTRIFLSLLLKNSFCKYWPKRCQDLLVLLFIVGRCSKNADCKFCKIRVGAEELHRLRFGGVGLLSKCELAQWVDRSKTKEPLRQQSLRQSN